MRSFFAALRQMITQMVSTVKWVSRAAFEAGVWTTKLAYEVVRVPVRAVCQVADSILSLVDRPKSSGGNDKADQARQSTEQQAKAANSQATRELIIQDLARLLQRTARFRELGHESAGGLAAELPDELRKWIKRLSTTECGRLAAMDTRTVVEFLKADNVEASLPGIRPISPAHEEAVAERFKVAASGRRAPDEERTEAEKVVLSVLAERLKARGRTARTYDDGAFSSSKLAQ